jgi:hypothetical protein
MIMVKSKFLAGFFASIIFLSCNKSQNQIDVSAQDKTDYSGNAIQWLNDGQWGPKVFTSQEHNLFKGLDTADLTGTTLPDSISASGSGFFPNPFSSIATLMISFSVGFTGQVELKYVIVDNNLNIKDLGAKSIQAPPDPFHPTTQSSSSLIHLNPTIPLGQYRIYYTLSTQTKPDFFTSWGNIEKTQ